MTPDQTKAFSDMRKGGQALKATQGIDDFIFVDPRGDGEILNEVLEAAKAAGRSDEMIVLSFANDECNITKGAK